MKNINIFLVYGVPSLAISSAGIGFALLKAQSQALAMFHNPEDWLKLLRIQRLDWMKLSDAELVEKVVMQHRIFGAIFGILSLGMIVGLSMAASLNVKFDLYGANAILLRTTTVLATLGFGFAISMSLYLLQNSKYFQNILNPELFVNLVLRPELPSAIANSASSQEVLNYLIDTASEKTNIALYAGIGCVVVGVAAIIAYEGYNNGWFHK